MATRTEILYICDLCDTTGDVTSHELHVDRVKVEIDACEKCWNKHSKGLELLIANGRRLTGRRASRNTAVNGRPRATAKAS